MTEVDWDEAARQWGQLVKEQDDTPVKLPVSDPKVIGFFFCTLGWFIRSMVLGDPALIAFSLGSVLLFTLVGVSKESYPNERPNDPNS